MYSIALKNLGDSHGTETALPSTCCSVQSTCHMATVTPVTWNPTVTPPADLNIRQMLHLHREDSPKSVSHQLLGRQYWNTIILSSPSPYLYHYCIWVS